MSKPAALDALKLTPVAPTDLEALTELRIEAMRPSLERIGRFDPQRARERFANSFDPQHTQHIEWGGERVGFVVLKPGQPAWLLDHLYIRPAYQSQGLGAAVLQQVFAQVDDSRAALRVGALRGSDSNRFYQRHGFVQVEESEWDIYYERFATMATPTPCLS